MVPFRRFAFFTVARDAIFVTLAASTLMLGFSFEPPLAFKIGATVALIFSLLLLTRSYFLTEERFLRSEAWLALTPEERPAGSHGRQLARAQLEELLLRFAKGSSGIASILYCSAMVLAASAGPGRL
jgi:hypothetical protein